MSKKRKSGYSMLKVPICINSAIDPYTIKAYSLEDKQCYNIVIDKEKYI